MSDSGQPVQVHTASVDDSRSVQYIVLPGQTPQGQYILSVLHKRSYDFKHKQRCTRAETDQKLVPGDVHYDDPVNSSVEFESDFVPFKLATDVVLNGYAYAPNQQSVPALTAILKVGEHQKSVRVIGDRVCHYRRGSGPVFTDPQSFERMPMRYEYAYGGVDIRSDPNMPFPYARNHLGRGFVASKEKHAIEQLVLPNLEDPNDLLTPERLCLEHVMYWEQQPLPQCFGWLTKGWQPRAGLAGVMPADRATEQELRAMYSPLIPPEQKELYEQTQLPDMDFRFFNGASHGLAVPFLRGDEVVHTKNLAPEGWMAFQLPGEQPKIGIDIGKGVQEPDVVLHTVMIRMEDRQVDLIWRAAVPYPGPDWLPEMKKMEASIQ